MNHTEPSIEIEHLVKEFRTGFLGRKIRVLHDVCLKVPAGKTFGFLGPNGAGKSTTIKILAGLLHATSGKVTIMGNGPQSLEGRRHIGFLPENPSFHDHLTGEEVLLFLCELLGIEKRARKARVSEVLELVNLSRATRSPVRHYSKGMVQRLGIAQALLQDPDLIILDEPMSGLDPVGRRDVRELIRTLRGRGKTIFFSTHIISDVEQICDEVAIIIGGQIVRSGPVSSFLNADAREVEILAAKVPQDLLGDRQLVSEGVVSFRVPSHEDARSLVEGLWSHGARVLSLNVRKYGLEDVFMTEIEKQPPNAAIRKD